MSRSATRRRAILLGGLALLVLAGAALFVVRSADSGVSPSWAADPSSSPGDRTAASPTSDAPVGRAASATTSAGLTPSAAPGTAVAGTPSSALASLASVTVSQTYSGWDQRANEVVAGGVVRDVVETGGTCVLTLTRAGVTLTGTSAATEDATTTSCGEMRVGGTALTSGTWQAVVGYTSAHSTGKSAAFSVVRP